MQNGSVTRKEFDVAVIGEINADLILNGNVEPTFNQVEKIVDRADLVMGSSAVIFACGIARLGLKTTFIGKVGDDVFGNFMVNAMKDRGIDVSSVCLDKTIRTGLSVILARTEDRAILTYPGSIHELEYEDIDFDKISRCQHLHLSGYYLLDKLRPKIPALFKTVNEMGLSISLDTNYDPDEIWNGILMEALKLVDVFLPNETEAMAISRQGNISEALDHFAEIVPIIVIKLGEKGACLKYGNNDSIYQTAAQIDVIDTVGAGDSFDSGFVYGYLNDWSMDQSLALAVACGSLSTIKAGGTDGQPTLESAKDFIHNNLKERK